MTTTESSLGACPQRTPAKPSRLPRPERTASCAASNAPFQPTPVLCALRGLHPHRGRVKENVGIPIRRSGEFLPPVATKLTQSPWFLNPGKLRQPPFLHWSSRWAAAGRRHDEIAAHVVSRRPCPPGRTRVRRTRQGRAGRPEKVLRFELETVQAGRRSAAVGHADQPGGRQRESGRTSRNEATSRSTPMIATLPVTDRQVSCVSPRARSAGRPLAPGHRAGGILPDGPLTASAVRLM